MKEELVAAMAVKSELSKKDVAKALKAFEEVVEEALARREKVQLVGFGTFEVVDRAAREGRNPQTGEPMEIPATQVPRFKAGKKLKDVVQQAG